MFNCPSCLGILVAEMLFVLIYVSFYQSGGQVSVENATNHFREWEKKCEAADWIVRRRGKAIMPWHYAGLFSRVTDLLS
jgi:hypothetical protein